MNFHEQSRTPEEDVIALRNFRIVTHTNAIGMDNLGPFLEKASKAVQKHILEKEAQEWEVSEEGPRFQACLVAGHGLSTSRSISGLRAFAKALLLFLIIIIFVVIFNNSF